MAQLASAWLSVQEGTSSISRKFTSLLIVALATRKKVHWWIERRGRAHCWLLGKIRASGKERGCDPALLGKNRTKSHYFTKIAL